MSELNTPEKPPPPIRPIRTQTPAAREAYSAAYRSVAAARGGQPMPATTPPTLAAVRAVTYLGPQTVLDAGQHFEAERYAVPSKSDPATTHELLWLRDKPLCTCMGFVQRGKCWHSALLPIARSYRWWREILAATTATETEVLALIPGKQQQAAHGPQIPEAQGAILAMGERLMSLRGDARAA